MKMTDADERALAVMQFARGYLTWNNMQEFDDALQHIRARLAADQQKGGGEVGLPGSLITHRYVWRKALELAVFSADPAHVEKWNRELAAYDQTFDRLWQLIEAEMKWPDPQPSIPAPAQQDCLPPGTPMMPSGAFHNALWKTMPAELQPHGRMLTQLWSVADSTEMKNALETAILSMSAQQDGKASGGEVDDAMVERACIAYYEQPAWAFMSHKAACKDRMRAALTVALAHPPHADQETQG